MPTIISRSEWGATPWRSGTTRVSLSQRTEFFVHWHGGVPQHDRGVAMAREVERIHLGNGWSGVGYNFLVGQDGVIYEGRGWDLAGAHCPGHNTSGFGVYVAVGKGGAKPTKEALTSVRWLYDEANRRTGKTLAKRGHRDGYATSCPGEDLYAWVRAGMPVEGGAPASAIPPALTKPKPKPSSPKPSSPKVKAPAFPLPRGYYFGPKSGPRESVSGYYSHRGDLRRWQAKMATRGWRLVADGLYGPATEDVVRAFQREKGLTVDGKIGPQTWAAAWEAPVT